MASANTKSSKSKGKASDGDLTVGDILRQARTEQKIKIKTIAQEINLRVGQLEALEEGQLDELPGTVYALGYLRSYAEYLGLDGEEMIARFKAEHTEEAEEKPEFNFPTPVNQSKIPDLKIVASGAFIAVVLIVLWYVFGLEGSSKVVDVKPLPNHLKGQKLQQSRPSDLTAQPGPAPRDQQTQDPAKGETGEVSPPPEEEPVKKVVKPKGRVLIKANQDTWVQIKDTKNDKTLLRRVLKPGESFYVPDRPGMELVTGNAGGMDIFVDGKAIAPIGGAGDIIHGVDLSPDSLLKKRVRMR